MSDGFGLAIAPMSEERVEAQPLIKHVDQRLHEARMCFQPTLPEDSPHVSAAAVAHLKDFE